MEEVVNQCSPCRLAPPIGPRPRWLWIEHRYQELREAIDRYRSRALLPKQEWIDEAVSLRNEIASSGVDF